MEFKVKFQLMVDPTKGDHTFNKSYTVEAENEREALEKAEALKDAVEDPEWGQLGRRTVFNYFIKKV
jgi:hypothetical protein